MFESLYLASAFVTVDNDEARKPPLAILPNVTGLIEISDRNSELIIWSFQTGERIGYIPIENLDDIQYRIYKNKLFIGGNYMASTIIAGKKYG